MSESTLSAKEQHLAAQTRYLTIQAEIAEDAWHWEQVKTAGRTYTIHGPIDDDQAYMYRTTLNHWLAYDPDPSITVVINSYGGSVFSGFSIYDWTLKAIRDGANINTKCIGYAASMAGILLQMGKVRSMTPNSHMMVHEASSFMRGGQSASILKDQTEFTEKLNARCISVLTSRSKLSATEITTKSDRRDWWLTAEEALVAGFIDEVEL